MKFNMAARIDEVEILSNRVLTFVTTPSPDAYSQPSTFRLFSAERLGLVGDSIAVECAVSGYIKRKSYKDKVSGENKIYKEANVSFNAVLLSAAEAKKLQ